MNEQQPTQAQFVSEAIEPDIASADTAAMATGAPGLPGRFRWRGQPFAIAEVLSTWKTSGPCSHGSGERYLRRHWYKVRVNPPAEMVLYFERQARRGSAGHRWFLYTVSWADPNMPTRRSGY